MSRRDLAEWIPFLSAQWAHDSEGRFRSARKNQQSGQVVLGRREACVGGRARVCTHIATETAFLDKAVQSGIF